MSQRHRDILEGAFVAEEVAKLRPGHAVLMIDADHLPAGPSDESTVQALEAAAAEAIEKKSLDHPHVEAWRHAMRSFGVNPSRFRNSVEALLRRAHNGGLPAINRLVDIYNAVSVKHVLPVGGEDAAAIAGSPRLVLATGEEEFETTDHGREVIEHPEPGEVIWRDDVGVTCRRWSHRQCRRTRITEESTHVLFILECLHPMDVSAMIDAGDDLIARITALAPEATFRSRLFAPVA
jgi:DNA/RNA-binding domain of Phe-tRNA-synthetase-like protein